MKTICFSRALYLGIESGAITQIRLPVNCKREPLNYHFLNIQQRGVCFVGEHPTKAPVHLRPYFKAGGFIGVKEPFADLSDLGQFFLYDYPEESAAPLSWLSSGSMTSEQIRLKLRLEDVRCQRLSEVTDEDAYREGIKEQGGVFFSPDYKASQPTAAATAVQWFIVKNNLPVKDFFTWTYSVKILNARMLCQPHLLLSTEK